MFMVYILMAAHIVYQCLYDRRVLSLLSDISGELLWLWGEVHRQKSVGGTHA